MGKYHSYLEESDLFIDLSRDQIDMIEEISTEISIKPGEMIFEEGSRETEVYIILKGKVEILFNPDLVSPTRAGHREYQTIAVLYEGQIFGEIALVDEGIRSAGARTSSSGATLLRFKRDRFLHFCTLNPEIGFKIMFNLAAGIGQKIRNAGMRIRESLLYSTKASEDQ